ncbi:unnamed protein product [Ectocarpus sp. CCAP 1310/34]|nr:unnamed protein product [Ectocarpus sp. CCAP 1310/34]
MKTLVQQAADKVRSSLMATCTQRRLWFPDAEKKLYKMSLARRKRKLRVSTRWITVTFKKLIMERYPQDPRAKAFRPSFRFAQKWATRHSLSKRWRSNSKNKSVAERLPKIRKWHREFRKLLLASHSPAWRSGSARDFCMQWLERSFRPSRMVDGKVHEEQPLLLADNLHGQTTEEFRKLYGRGPADRRRLWTAAEGGCGGAAGQVAGRGDNLQKREANALTCSERRVLFTSWVAQATEEIDKDEQYRFRLFEKTGCGMTADGSGDDKINLEGLSTYSFMDMEGGASADEESKEDKDTGKVDVDQLSEDSSSSDDESDGDDDNDKDPVRKRLARDPLTQLDDYDELSPEEEALKMDIPDGFRLQASPPPALDQSIVKRGVLVKLGLGWFGGMKMPLDSYNTDEDAAIGAWVLLEVDPKEGIGRRKRGIPSMGRLARGRLAAERYAECIQLTTIVALCALVGEEDLSICLGRTACCAGGCTSSSWQRQRSRVSGSTTSRGRFDFKELFRFEKPHFLELLDALQLPDMFEVSRGGYGVHRVSARLAFAVTLWRLAAPTTLIRDRILWGMSEALMCEIFNLTTEAIFERWGDLVNDLQVNAILPKTDSFCEAIAGRGSPLTRCWGFLGGTIHSPDGINFGVLYSSFNDAAGAPYYIYGDPAYQVSPWLMAPYKGLLSVAEVAFNRAMSRVRVTVEWGFGRVVALWPFVDYVKKQQVALSACGLGKQYAVASILTIFHCCFYPNSTAKC